LFAPTYHAATRHAAGPRKELGIRTVFNLLGPLTNPAGARRQVVGVYAPDLVEPIAQALAALGCEHALVAHGAGGLDELTPTGENLVAEVRDGEVTITKVDPRQFGAGPGVPGDLGGGDASDNAAIVRTVFDGETGPRRDAVILNAGAALYVAGVSDSLEQGVYAARDAIDDGRATATLDRLIAFTSARADALI
jgi:anthranilate phosphoribosyltransferase